MTKINTAHNRYKHKEDHSEAHIENGERKRHTQQQISEATLTVLGLFPASSLPRASTTDDDDTRGDLHHACCFDFFFSVPLPIR